MGGFVAAWIVGEGIIIFRSVRQVKSPPPPGQLLASSALFVMLGFLAQAPKATMLATTLAWGFDAAALLNLFPAVTGGTPATAAPASQGTPPKGVSIA